jgi:molybdopterin converting factor subunit 1
MTIQVLLFASYREMAGASTLQVEVPSGSTVEAVIDALRRRGGGLASLPADPPVAVNRTWAPSGTELQDGDEVALLPPVAGG